MSVTQAPNAWVLGHWPVWPVHNGQNRSGGAPPVAAALILGLDLLSQHFCRALGSPPVHLPAGCWETL